MDAVKELFQINFSYILISVFIVLIGVRTIASPLEWLVSQLGLETKWMRKRREEHDLLLNTSKNLIALQEKHIEDMKRSDEHDEEMRNDIKKLTDLFIDKQINDYRWEIIHLADTISSGNRSAKNVSAMRSPLMKNMKKSLPNTDW